MIGNMSRSLVPSISIALSAKNRSQRVRVRYWWRNFLSSGLVLDIPRRRSLILVFQMVDLSLAGEGRKYRIDRSTIWNTKIKEDRKSTRLNSSHVAISYAVFCLKKKTVEKLTKLHA